MTQMEPKNLSNVGQQLFKHIEFDKDEKLLYEIRKHGFGLFLIYFLGFFISTIMFVALVIGASYLGKDPLDTGADFDSLRIGMIVLGAVLTLVGLAATAIGAYLYQSNVVLITSEKLAQVLYKNIFDRKVSQLSIGDVQDVTVSQKGILARIFHYGTLVIETAGEQQNYAFTFTPNPYAASKAIVAAHEENLRLYGN